MLKFESTTAKDGAAAAAWADTCCSVYCRAGLAFLCSACEAAASPHERLRLCESCGRAPAEFVCKADSASLCAACDAEVHSANPLACRHHRVPIKPVPGGLEIRPSGNAGGDEDEAASWLLLNPIKTNEDDEEIGAALLDGGEVDEYLDLDEYNSFSEGYNSGQLQQNGGPQRSYGSDSDVPMMQYQKGKDIDSFGMGLEGGYAYPASMSQSVSISSMDIGVVPELTRPAKGTIDLFSSQPPAQLSPTEREARVLRYREKKKTRRFEKTIRYASRKAYAETRPRIKGRFAKRRDEQVEVDHMFSSASLMAETGYGVVPSF